MATATVEGFPNRVVVRGAVTSLIRLLGLATAVLFFANAALYPYAKRLSTVTPLMWVVAIGGLVLVVAIWHGVDAAIHNPLLPWGGCYLLLTAASYGWSSGSDTAWQEVLARVLGVITILMLLVLFSHAEARVVARRGVVAAVVCGVLLNLYDLTHPLVFSNVIARGAGLYINPNISGDALTLGALIGLPIVPKRWREGYVLFALLGVLATVSRSALLAFAVMLVILFGSRRVRLGRLCLLALMVAVPVAGIAVYRGLTLHQVAVFTGVGDRSLEQVLSRVGGTQGSDASTRQRIEAAQLAWSMFANRPLTGYGVGATIEWPLRESAHNLYLRHAAEYGVLGLLIFPLMALCLVTRTRSSARLEAYAAATVLLQLALFSHNMLDELPSLFCIALVGAEAEASRRPEVSVSLAAGTPMTGKGEFVHG